MNSAGVISKRGSEDYKASMVVIRKINKGGHCHRYEPMDMNLLNEDPTTMEVSKRTGCLQFFQGCKAFIYRFQRILPLASQEHLQRLEF